LRGYAGDFCGSAFCVWGGRFWREVAAILEIAALAFWFTPPQSVAAAHFAACPFRDGMKSEGHEAATVLTRRLERKNRGKAEAA
jgi:hypothetical protein